MKKHLAIIKPKFDLVERKLKDALGDKDLAFRLIKIDSILASQSDWHFELWLWPLLTGLAFIAVYPWAAQVVSMWPALAHKKGSEWKENANLEKRLLPEESARLRGEILGAQAELERHLKARSEDQEARGRFDSCASRGRTSVRKYRGRSAWRPTARR